MGLRRIFIVGDSMQWNFAQALWKLFSGAPGDPARVHSKKNGKVIAQTVDCGASYRVSLRFLLNNRLTNTSGRFWEGPFEFFPWEGEYLEGTAPTLFLAHMGAHVRYRRAVVSLDLSSAELARSRPISPRCAR